MFLFISLRPYLCMPIFNKSTVVSKRKRLKRIVNKFADTRGPKKKIVFRRPARAWGFEKTNFNRIDFYFGGALSKEINSLVSSSKSKVRILDWGCGRGVALADLAKILPANKVSLIGFSADTYPEWLSLSKKKNIIFLNSSAPVLERYLRSHPVDLIFSNLGLVHLNEGAARHIVALKRALPVGGKIFVSEFNKSGWKEGEKSIFTHAMRRAGFDINFISVGDFILTRKK